MARERNKEEEIGDVPLFIGCYPMNHEGKKDYPTKWMVGVVEAFQLAKIKMRVTLVNGLNEEIALNQVELVNISLMDAILTA